MVEINRAEDYDGSLTIADLQQRILDDETELVLLREENERLKEELDRQKDGFDDLQARLAEAKKWKTAWELQDHGDCYARLSAAEEELKLLRFAEPKEYANAKRLEAKLKRAEAVVEAAKPYIRRYGSPEENEAIRRYEEGK